MKLQSTPGNWELELPDYETRYQANQNLSLLKLTFLKKRLRRYSLERPLSLYDKFEKSSQIKLKNARNSARFGFCFFLLI